MNFFRHIPYQLFMMIAIGAIGCGRSDSNDVADMPLMYEAPVIIPLDTVEGYTVNPSTGKIITPIINSQGDTVVTGKKIKANPVYLSRRNDDFRSIKVPVKSPEKELFFKNKRKLKGEIEKTFIDWSSLNSDSTLSDRKRSFIINQYGDTVPTGEKIKASWTEHPAIHSAGILAGERNYRNNAVADISQLGSSEGLFTDHASKIIFDSDGNMWIASREEGLARYDGNRFFEFKENEGLINKRIWSIFEDSKRRIWIGTVNGLCVYDKRNFLHYTDRDGLPNKGVNDIFEDSHGNMWFGTQNGLSRFDGDYFFNYSVNEGLSSNFIADIEEDSSGHLWIATSRGLNRFDGQRFIQLNESNVLKWQNIKSVKTDKEGKIWIGGYGIGCIENDSIFFLTEKNGVPDSRIQDFCITDDGDIWTAYRYEGVIQIKNNEITNYNTENGLSDNYVHSIIQGPQGNIWLAPEDGGLDRINPHGFQFCSKEQGVSDGVVYPIFQDSQEHIWFGYGRSDVGLSILKEDTIYHHKGTGLCRNSVWSFCEDRQGHIWIGSWGQGMSIFDGSHSTHTEFRLPKRNIVMAILESRDSSIWIGTHGGLLKVVGDSFACYTDKNGLSANSIREIHEDQEGNFWITYAYANAGISKFDGKSFIHFSEKEGLPHNGSFSVSEDPNQNIWMGSIYAGYTMFNGHSFVHISESQGLVNESGGNFLLDSSNNIWLGTQRGMSMIPETYWRTAGKEETYSAKWPHIQNFQHLDGFKSLDFNSNRSAWIDHKNRAWWGSGAQKIYMLDFENYRYPTSSLEVKLSGLEINEMALDYHHLNDSIQTAVQFADISGYNEYPIKLELDHNYNHLTFHFSNNDWKSPYSVRYSFQIQDLDNSWSSPSSIPMADYRNIPYGEHTFRVRAIGRAGLWSQAFEYHFTVHPPWWHTIWARIAYGLTAILLILIFIQWRTSKLQTRQKLLKAEIKDATKELRYQRADAERARMKAERSEAIKQQFLANMSHEIRTPMNAILGMTSLTLDTELNEKQRDYLTAVRQSSENLLVIINDILDLSKLEAGKLNLEFIPFNLEDQLDVVHKTLRYKAEEKGLTFEVKQDKSVPKFIKGDPYRLNQILINLIGNAIKFTEKGQISLDVSLADGKNERLKFSVKDTGIGIPKDKQEILFSAFRQVEEGTTRKYGGTGLGLSISKTLVELQNGKIEFKSEEGKGSEFYFELPFELADEEDIRGLDREKSKDVSGLEGIRILLAEDNKFNQLVLHDTIKHLVEDSEIDIAENGALAVDQLRSNDYDVILMDINMPELNGLEATQMIRNELPEPKNKSVILALTASVLNDDIRSFQNAGMDGYIPKPFTREELLDELMKHYPKNGDVSEQRS